MSTDTTTVVAQRAVEAIHDLARLTRPAISDLDRGDLYDLTGAIADLVGVLPQVLNQLARYEPAGDTGTCLSRAARLATELSALLDRTHQSLD